MGPILIIFVLVLALMIPLVAVVLDSQLGRALAARLEGRQVDALADRRITALEGEVDRLNKEVQRLAEEGAFLQRLLEQRPAPDALPPGDEPD